MVGAMRAEVIFDRCCISVVWSLWDAGNKLGEEVSGNTERRLLWLEAVKAINTLIPRTDWPEGKVPMPSEVPLEDRIDIEVTQLDNKYYEDLATWYTPQKSGYTDWPAYAG